MLCQFTFKNFRSYKNETLFDMQAANLPEFDDCIIKSENSSDILPVSVIYGPNGGGKSNVLKALACLISTVVRPIIELEKNRVKLVITHYVNAIPYEFDDNSKNEPTEFEIFFRTSKNEFRYALSLLNNEVKGEYLHRRSIGGKRTAVIFERIDNQVELGASIKKSNINTEVNPKMPYLSFLAINYNLDVITEVQKWFESCIIRNYANPYVVEQKNETIYAKMKSLIIKLMNYMDINITDFHYNNTDNQFYLQRKISGESYELEFLEESEGTKKLFSILPMIIIALTNGCPIILDELDSMLHPKLLRYIIMLFKNPQINKKGAQLIFTSHDLSTMKNDVFRRDEIWFAAKNSEDTSILYSLYEIRREDNKRINNTAAYDKQYLEGRYGADPYLEAMLNWEV